MKSKILTFLLAALLGFTGATEHPFDYDLHLFSLSGSHARTMICFIVLFGKLIRITPLYTKNQCLEFGGRSVVDAI